MADLARYGKMFEEAETSVDYWMGVPVIELSGEICRLMEEKNVSRAELARRMGTSRAYITKLLAGSTNFTLATMVKLAMAFDGVLHVHIADKRAVTRWHDQPWKGGPVKPKAPARARKRPSQEGLEEERQG
jgi:transcriptional regulator with XRE-family HTH domain